MVVDDGSERKTISLNRSYLGLLVPNLIWRRLDNFSTNAVCLILASDHYAPEDYIRDYGKFLSEVREHAT